MRELVYVLVMIITMPLWKLAMLVMDIMFEIHKKMVEWVEK